METQINELPLTTAELRRGMTDGLHIGAQVYVWQRGRVMADFGLGDSRPGIAMTPDTLMLWMSATKPLGAVAIAQLWERNLLKLDDPVALHIPEFAVNGKEGITIRHVLTHTAGIRWIETGWPLTPWEQIIARICAMRPERDWTPGRKAGYSAYVSWFLLGEIIRRLDGRDFATYVRQEIFEPLAMNDSWVAMPIEVYRGYGTRLGMMQKTEGGQVTDLGLDTEAACTNARPSGSGHGPMRELGRFYEMLLAGGSLNGRRLISPQTVDALVARQRTGMYDHTFRHVIDWGLGFVLNSNQYGAATVPYGYGPYAGANTYGHGGSQSSSAFADPDNCLVAAIVLNGTPGEAAHDHRMRAIHAALYDDLELTGDHPQGPL
jgi:CubicO group peptidase (beta-lactamase class C family)